MQANPKCHSPSLDRGMILMEFCANVCAITAAMLMAAVYSVKTWAPVVTELQKSEREKATV